MPVLRSSTQEFYRLAVQLVRKKGFAPAQCDARQPSAAAGSAGRDEWKRNPLQPITWSVSRYQTSDATFFSDVGNRPLCSPTCAKRIFSCRTGSCVYLWLMPINSSQVSVLGSVLNWGGARGRNNTEMAFDFSQTASIKIALYLWSVMPLLIHSEKIRPFSELSKHIHDTQIHGDFNTEKQTIFKQSTETTTSSTPYNSVLSFNYIFQIVTSCIRLNWWSKKG